MDQKRKDDSDDEDDDKNKQQQRKAFFFDRLRPRGCSKRKLGEEEESSSSSSSSSSSKKLKGAREEYTKLKGLVPALSEREDLSKVEIIEETIRYIDALHHQLATKGILANATSNDESSSSATSIMTSSSTTSPTTIPSTVNTTLVHSTSTSSSPLRSLDSEPQGHRPTAPSSSSSRSSPQDVKAAVENIQAMFAAYLEQNDL